MAKNESEEVISDILEHLRWAVEQKKKYHQPVCEAADYLLDAFTKQMQTVYRAGWENGLEEAHQIANYVQDKTIERMREYAKKHPKMTLESYLKREFPEES